MTNWLPHTAAQWWLSAGAVVLAIAWAVAMGKAVGLPWPWDHRDRD